MLFCSVVLAQEIDLSIAHEQELNIRKTGMIILGSWAVVNMAIGLYGRNSLDGTKKYFHEMNFFWNLVNAGIAGAGYYFSLKAEIPTGYPELLQEQMKFQKILLFNAGLDLAYIMGGVYLMERSKNVQKNTLRFKGYGQSLVLQGAFLFVFDVVLHTIHSQQNEPLINLLTNLYLTPNQIGFAFRL